MCPVPLTPACPDQTFWACRNARIKWTSRTNKAFEACKEALATATLLNHPRPGIPLSIAVDDSDSAISAVTVTNGNPLLSFPRLYHAASHDIAPLAVKHFHPYMKAKEFHILTDRKPLIFALHSRNRRQSLDTWTTFPSSRQTSVTFG